MLPARYITDCQLHSQTALSTLEKEGFASLPVLSADVINELEEMLFVAGAFDYDFPQGSGLLQHAALRYVAEQLAGILNNNSIQPVQIFVLDKTPGQNWELPWHQDRYIAVKEKKEIPGYNNWSSPAGVPYVEPPVQVLEKMLTIRIHLDECHEFNGPMWMIPGTHRSGYLDKEEIEHISRKTKKVCGTFPRGGILLFHPLLLHYSPLSQSPDNRRVLQIEYANRSLLNASLQWHE